MQWLGLTNALSASQIAARLGGVTRNACIAKIHRLGMSGRSSTSRKSAYLSRPPTKKRPPLVSVSTRKGRDPSGTQQSPAPIELVPHLAAKALAFAERDALRVTFAELETEHCRWPIGDPRTATFCFCGKERAARAALPYCEGHGAIAIGQMPAGYPSATKNSVPGVPTHPELETVA